MKLTYNKWRLRKYTAVAEKKTALRREMQHTISVKRGRSQRQQIPFGVRALESGIEVDGVWISGSNTPASTPGSPNSAVMKMQPTQRDQRSEASSSISEMSRIDVPQPVHEYSGTNHSAGPSHKLPTPLDRPISSERHHSKPPNSDHQKHGRPTYQPRQSSHLRFSNSLSPEDSEAFAALRDRTVTAGGNGKHLEGEHLPLCQGTYLANTRTIQAPTRQGRRIVAPRHGLATLRTHQAARIIATGTSLGGRPTIIYILHLVSLQESVPQTHTIPTDTSLFNLTLLQAIPNHTWTNRVDYTCAIEKVG